MTTNDDEDQDNVWTQLASLLGVKHIAVLDFQKLRPPSAYLSSFSNVDVWQRAFALETNLPLMMKDGINRLVVIADGVVERIESVSQWHHRGFLCVIGRHRCADERWKFPGLIDSSHTLAVHGIGRTVAN